jgi:hypothetical protein
MRITIKTRLKAQVYAFGYYLLLRLAGGGMEDSGAAFFLALTTFTF